MKYSQSPCSNDLSSLAQELQISALGIARNHAIPPEVINIYQQWIDAEKHGEMAYMAKYKEIRLNPQELLPGTQSIIVAAFNYHSPIKTPADNPQFASYSLGDDYHEVVRERLSLLASFIQEKWGGVTRVCVDTAPIFERYWAQQAGVGFIGRNKMLIVPQIGSYVFIGIILSTVEFKPDEPCTLDCMGCNACIRHCPGKAISLNGPIDARKCHSYLTIEYRGDLPDDLDLGNRVYGCDVCQTVCPHNLNAPTTNIAEFLPRKEILNLTHDDIDTMSQEEFSRIFSHSAIKRTKLAGLQRNNRHCSKK